MFHKNYELLSYEEKEFVDAMFSRDVFKQAAAELGYPLAGDDRAEQAVEAVSTWLVESAKDAGKIRTPYITGDMFNTVFGPKTGAPCPEVIATIHKGNRANAQAIAALPDLIAALRSALGSCAYMLADCADDDSEHFQRLEIEINEAFAKAGIR